MMTALLTMTTRRFVILLGGVALLVAGLLALELPVLLSAFDQYGFEISCGNGFQIALTQAGIADASGAHFIDQCHAAVAVRRSWSIALAMVGVLMLGGLVATPPRQAAATK